MPKTRSKVTTIYTSLSGDEQMTFDAVARSKGLSRSELAREAIRYFLQRQDQLDNEVRDSKIDQRLKKMEDRLAGLMARTAIDVGVMYTLMWRNLPGNREEQLTSAYTQAVNRLKKKMSDADAQVKEELMK